MSEAQPETGEFWQFTLECYGREGVQSAVIALQDQRNADVNVMFYCCWIAASGRGVLSADDVRCADAAIDAWRREVTIKLRSIRSDIKATPALWALAGAADVRGKVLGAEIQSEQVTQDILESMAPAAAAGVTSAVTNAVANLRTYFAARAIETDASDRDHLVSLLCGTLPASNEFEIREQLATVSQRP